MQLLSSSIQFSNLVPLGIALSAGIILPPFIVGDPVNWIKIRLRAFRRFR